LRGQGIDGCRKQTNAPRALLILSAVSLNFLKGFVIPKIPSDVP